MKIPLVKSQEVLFYLDGYSLKAVSVLTRGGDRRIEHVYYRDVSGLDDAGVIEEILAAAKAVHARTREIRAIVSSRFTINKTVEVPSFDEKEIGAIVKLQASRHTPYSKEEIAIAHLNLEVLFERYTRSLLVILSLSNVQKHLELLRSAGLEIQAVYAAFEGTSAGLAKAMAVPQDQIAAILFVDRDHTDFVILHKEKPFFVRSFAIGDRQLASVADREEFLKEIAKSHEAYLSVESARPIDRLYVLGGSSADLETASSMAREKLRIAGGGLLKAQDHVPVGPEAHRELADFRSGALDDAMLCAWASDRLVMDLIPDDLATRRRLRRRAQDIFTAAVSAMVIFVMLLGTLMGGVYFKKCYLKALGRSFEAKNHQAERLVLLSEQNRLIRDLEQKKGTSLRVLVELEKILPREMYLNEMSLDAEGKVAIRGTSELMSSVFSFVSGFENSKLFKNVKTEYAKSRKVEGKDVTDFGLSANLEEAS